MGGVGLGGSHNASSYSSHHYSSACVMVEWDDAQSRERVACRLQHTTGGAVWAEVEVLKKKSRASENLIIVVPWSEGGDEGEVMASEIKISALLACSLLEPLSFFVDEWKAALLCYSSYSSSSFSLPIYMRCC